MGKKILVADDSATIQKVIKLALSADGYDIQTVTDGAEAIKAIEQISPDLVLIDISLPQIDAFEIKKRVSGNPKTAGIGFVLMVSAFERPDEAQIQHLHFQGRLIKPFDPAHLRKVVTSAFVKIAELRPSVQVEEFEPTLSVSSFSGLPIDLPPVTIPIQSEQDIQGLTASTIKMSKLDELDWNLDDSKHLKATVANIKSTALRGNQKNAASKNPTLVVPPQVHDMSAERSASFQIDQATAVDDGGTSFLNQILVPKNEVMAAGKRFDLAGSGVHEDSALIDTLPPLGPIDPITTISTPPPPPRMVTVEEVRERTKETSTAFAKAVQEPLTKAVAGFNYDMQTTGVSRSEIEQIVRKELGDFLSRFARDEMPRIAEDVIRKEIEKILHEP